MVREWVQSNDLQFGCLLETRVKEYNASRIISSVFHDWSSITNYEFSPLGRIWVVWRNNIRVTPVFKSGQLITCSILVDGVAEEFFVTFVYAANLAEDRRELWLDIQHHFDAPMFRNKPWLIMGDFNETLDGEEHSGFEDSPSITSGMRDFQDTTRYCSLVDMSFHGPLYTWCNKREESLICKKLDRVLVNETWNHSFSESYGVFESGGCSGHLRCRFKIGTEARRPRGSFKFSNVFTSQNLKRVFLNRSQSFIGSKWGTKTTNIFIMVSKQDLLKMLFGRYIVLMD